VRCRCLLALVTALLGVLVAVPSAGAAGEHMLGNANLTVTFATDVPTAVAGITWGSVTDYVATGGEGCSAELFGDSYDAVDGTRLRPVGPGFTGEWSAEGGAAITVGEVDPLVCPSPNAVPVRTTFTIGDDVHVNTLHVVRTFGFGTGIADSSPLLAFVPRLPFATYDEVLYGADGGGVGSVPSSATGELADWAGRWYALNAADGHGVLVLNDPANPAPTEGLHVARGDASASNATAIAYAPPGGQWSGQVRLESYVCFYDATTWPAESRATSPPQGCGAFVRPVGAVTMTTRATAAVAPQVRVSWEGLEPSAGGVTVCVYAIGRPGNCVAAETVSSPVRRTGWLTLPGGATKFAARVRAYTDFDGARVRSAGVLSATWHATRLRPRTCRAFYDETCRLQVRLVDRATGSPVAGVPVQLWRRPYSGSGDYTLVTTRTTDARGVASHSFAPRHRAAYQWRFRGATRLLATETAFRLPVHFRVTAHVTKATVATGRTVRIWGRVRPGLAGTPVQRWDWNRARHRYVFAADDPTAETVVTRRRLPNGRVAFGYVLKVRVREGVNRFRTRAASYQGYTGWFADVSVTGR
jgi:5-hydroxyisourate hydrolase-like protein (transthyretin family)